MSFGAMFLILQEINQRNKNKKLKIKRKNYTLTFQFLSTKRLGDFKSR